MNLVNTFEIDLLRSPSLASWLKEQLLCVRAVMKEIRTRAESPSHPSHASPQLFGAKKESLAHIIPESAGISGYINAGMGGLSVSRLLSDYQMKMKYRSSNAGALQQVADGGIYASGVPGGHIPVVNPKPLEALPITSLDFAFDVAAKRWTVTVHQHYAKPRKAKNTL